MSKISIDTITNRDGSHGPVISGVTTITGNLKVGSTGAVSLDTGTDTTPLIRTSSGLIGIGGAIIMIPALIFFIGMNQYEAQGTSLAVMLPPIGILAAYNYYRAGELNIKYALIIAGAFIIGGYLGSKLALNIPVGYVRRFFGIALLLISLHLIFNKA